MSKPRPIKDCQPSPGEFLKAGLYKRFPLDALGYEGVLRIEFYRPDALDEYCLHCKRESVFSSSNPFPSRGQRQMMSMGPVEFEHDVPATRPPAKDVEELITSDVISVDGTWQRPEAYALKPHTFSIEFACSRDAAHPLIYYCRVDGDGLQKIGQYPSVADLHTDQLKDYRPVLTDEQRRELAKGIGLFAHGVGIGSFVYIRRVFEQFVESARVEAA
jgi:hypothetical protein